MEIKILEYGFNTEIKNVIYLEIKKASQINGKNLLTYSMVQSPS